MIHRIRKALGNNFDFAAGFDRFGLPVLEAATALTLLVQIPIWTAKLQRLSWRRASSSLQPGLAHPLRLWTRRLHSLATSSLSKSALACASATSVPFSTWPIATRMA